MPTDENYRIAAVGAFNYLVSTTSITFSGSLVIRDDVHSVLTYSETAINILNMEFRLVAAQTVDELKGTFKFAKSNYDAMDKNGIGGTFFFDTTRPPEQEISKEDIGELAVYLASHSVWREQWYMKNLCRFLSSIPKI